RVVCRRRFYVGMYAAYCGYDPPTPSNEQESFLSQCHLAGIDGRRLDFPEVYCGKTGLDIPCIQLESFDTEVFASYTGPDGGLTQGLPPLRSFALDIDFR
ncbi:hypothetical protein ANCDUO_16841, partial [Ancylostoma duodenale]